MIGRTQTRLWSGRSARWLLHRWAYEVTHLVRQAQAAWLIVLVALNVSSTLMTYEFREAWPLSSFLIPLLLAMNVLSLDKLLVLELTTILCIVESGSMIHLTALRLVGVGVVALGAVIVTSQAWTRTRHGLLPALGDSMLIDLRDRLASQSQLPTLPRVWYAEAVIAPGWGSVVLG